jgi:hypothetical protein
VRSEFLQQWNPENGGSMFLWNTDIYLQVPVVLLPRRPKLKNDCFAFRRNVEHFSSRNVYVLHLLILQLLFLIYVVHICVLHGVLVMTPKVSHNLPGVTAGSWKLCATCFKILNIRRDMGFGVCFCTWKLQGKENTRISFGLYIVL